MKQKVNFLIYLLIKYYVKYTFCIRNYTKVCNLLLDQFKKLKMLLTTTVGNRSCFNLHVPPICETNAAFFHGLNNIRKWLSLEYCTCIKLGQQRFVNKFLVET